MPSLLRGVFAAEGFLGMGLVNVFFFLIFRASFFGAVYFFLFRFSEIGSKPLITNGASFFLLASE